MRLNDGRALPAFIGQALRGEDLTVFGDGSQTRSFCYVDDLIDGMLKAMNTEEDFTGPVNLGNPSEFTMVELAEKVLRLTSSKSKMVFKPLPQDDPKQRKPDISLAKAKLNWQPKMTLDDGLKLTVDYFKATLNL
jgi:UDP-glucuronate decarboxylase